VASDRFLLFVTLVIFCSRLGCIGLGVVISLIRIERTTVDEQTEIEQKQTKETKISDGSNY
jgi:hypothetical protein